MRTRDPGTWSSPARRSCCVTPWCAPSCATAPRSRNNVGFIGRWWLRATRLLAAAEAELTVGSLDRAGALLDRAHAGPTTLAPRRLYYPRAAGLLGARYAQTPPRQPADRQSPDLQQRRSLPAAKSPRGRPRSSGKG